MTGFGCGGLQVMVMVEIVYINHLWAVSMEQNVKLPESNGKIG